MARERLKSRLGFILLSAGCAIGIGNVWKFPYVTGQNGGGFFVLIYLFFLIALGVPVMTMEFSMGRAAQKSVVKMYQQLERPDQKWHIHGIFGFIANYILMMFYTTVSGWMLKYFVSTAKGDFIGLDTAGIKAEHTAMLADPLIMTIFMGITVIIATVVCSFSLQGGLERITKIMMSALIGIMLVLVINSIFLEGGAEGLEFYLLPDVEKIKNAGVWNVIVAAMNQALFTLSIGIGSMAVFGSYIGKDRSLMGESINIALLDTFVAISAGLIIFPACFAYGVDVNSGPDLLFITLPNIFNNLPLGRLWGSLFFVFMSFAALSTVLAVFENIISCTMDLLGWGRKKASIANGILLFFLSMPCVLGFNLLKAVQPLGEGSTIMDIEDFAVNNVILPVGALIFVLFCVSRYGWGWDNFMEEANQGKGLKVQKWMRGYMTYVLPVILTIFIIIGILPKN